LYWNQETSESTKKYFKNYFINHGTKVSDDIAPEYLINFDNETDIGNDKINITLKEIRELDLGKLKEFYESIKKNDLRLIEYDHTLYIKNRGGNLFKCIQDKVPQKVSDDQLIKNINDSVGENNIENIKKHLYVKIFKYLFPAESAPFDDPCEQKTGTKVISKTNVAAAVGKIEKPGAVQIKSDQLDRKDGVYDLSPLTSSRDLAAFVNNNICSFVACFSKDEFTKIIDANIANVKDNYTQNRNPIMGSNPCESLKKCNNSADYIDIKDKTKFLSIVYTHLFDHFKKSENLAEQPDLSFVPSGQHEIEFILKNISKADNIPFLAMIDRCTNLKTMIGSKTQDNDNQYEAQIHRIRDPERDFFPPTSVLMHCITGQRDKKDMVDTTLRMCQTLYDAVNVTKASTI